MWGYDRAGESLLVPHKTEDEHFELFCLVLERGFAIHTGHSDRLVVEFRLCDTGTRRYLPRISAKKGISFRIPEDWLNPSDLYLHYDPSSDADIPTLAYFRPDSSTFIPYDYQDADLLDPQRSDDAPLSDIVLPVVKLSTLKGLHYIKDIACLQMYQLDFQRLQAADQVLAKQVKEVLTRKMQRFLEFSHPWVQANYAERIAREYLASHAPGPSASAAAAVKSKPQAGAGEATPDAGFLSWD